MFTRETATWFSSCLLALNAVSVEDHVHSIDGRTPLKFWTAVYKRL